MTSRFIGYLLALSGAFTAVAFASSAAVTPEVMVFMCSVSAGAFGYGAGRQDESEEPGP